ncbi:MAG: hypothetical protein DRP74_02815 [Candidatus Omnitrophota bacterium]|nr:MAG: hypothetical protein DRP74_02815 [Candidatus Omnitrophota bacterium]
MNNNSEEVEFTIFDTETTGLRPQAGDRIIEIAAIRIRGNIRKAVFHSLVNPQRRNSEAAFLVNKITDEMLLYAPLAGEVLPKFLDFIRGSHICSYNAVFDLDFLNKELMLLGRKLPEKVVALDILTMARRLLPSLERYSLLFVAGKLGIESQQEHRALSDVELALKVFNRLKDMMRPKGITDLNSFINLFSVNPEILNELENQKIAQIQQALDLGFKLRIKYLARRDAAVSQREVIPEQVLKEKNRNYLIGHCCLRNERRSFRLDGILHLEII